MNYINILILLLLIVSISFLSATTEESEDIFPDDITFDDDIIESSNEEDGEFKVYDGNTKIETNFLFPESSIKHFIVGDKITLLIGIINKSKTNLNISSIGGFLQSPFDSNMYIQNYTRRDFGAIVPAGNEGTFEYVFRPDPRIDPNEYHFSADLIFHDNSKLYRSLVFNGTIELTEKYSAFNPQALLSFILVGLLLAAIAYFSLQALRDHKWIKARTYAKADASTADSTSDDWGLAVHKQKASKDSKKKQ